MKSLDIRRGPNIRRIKKSLAAVATATFPKAASTEARLEPKSIKRPKRLFRKAIWGTAGLMILLLAVFSFLVLPEARVNVTVRSEPITRDFQIQVSSAVSGPNAEDLSVPGKILEQEMTGTKTYPASGSKNIGKTASGFVQLYNFSKTPLILKAATTVLTANGRKYSFTQDAGGIRPTALLGLEQQEVDPTSLTPPVPLVAGGPGPEYNLPKGTRLEIQNEAFGRQPKLLYALVAEDISGGTNQEVKIVTAADVSQAAIALSHDLVSQARQALVAENPNWQLSDNAVTTSVEAQKPSVAAGAQVDQFALNLKIKLQALVYDQSQVREILAQRIGRLLSSNQVLQTDPATQSLIANFINLNLAQGSGVLAVHFEGTVIYRLDQTEILQKIKGRTPEEIREILLSRPEIRAVTIKLYPFWVRRVPSFGNKVYLQIQEPTNP